MFVFQEVHWQARRGGDRTTPMRLRLGLVVGFGVGYYLGAKAGRVRYEQIRRTLERAQPLGKAVALAELGLERLRTGSDRSDQPRLPFGADFSNN